MIPTLFLLLSLQAPPLTCEQLAETCWAQTHACRLLRDVSQFVQYMTGPGGSLVVVTIGNGGTQGMTTIAPHNIWQAMDFDDDRDGDVDLRDYATWEVGR